MSKPEMPAAGGSYIRNEDGSLTRVEFTIQPGEPGHGELPPTPAGEQEARSGEAATGKQKKKGT